VELTVFHFSPPPFFITIFLRLRQRQTAQRQYTEMRCFNGKRLCHSSALAPKQNGGFSKRPIITVQQKNRRPFAVGGNTVFFERRASGNLAP
jgi:hypothetical protein